MLIYNTTFHVEMNDARNFVIWLNECYIPEAEKTGCGARMNEEMAKIFKDKVIGFPTLMEVIK